MALQADVMQLPPPATGGTAPNAWNGVPNSGDQILFANNDSANTWSLGFRNTITPGGANTIPLLPNSTVTLAANRTVYATAPVGTSPLVVIPGASAYFQTSTLSGLGGAKVFVQSTAPTQPPTIPFNSIWFNTTLNALEYWNGTTWVIQAFAGTQLIQAGTIVANLIAAGTIVAGIVNGTEIDGSKVRITNSFGATVLTINITMGTWLLYNDTGSATQGAMSASGTAAQVTDEFGNVALAGLTAYGLAMSGVWIASNFGVTNSAFGVTYYTATSQAGPWSLDSWVRRSGSSAGQLEMGPIAEFLGTALSPATPASGSKLWAPSAGTNINCLRVMKPDGAQYGVGQATFELPVDQTISAAWAVGIAGGGVNLSSPVANGIQYYWKATIRAITTVAGTLDLGVTGPATSQSNWWFLGSTSPTQSPQTALTFVAPNLAGATDYSVTMWGTFTPSANGTFSLAAGTGTAGNFTVKNGTFLTVRTSV